MDAPSPCPNAISHRVLSQLQAQAPVEATPEDLPGSGSALETLLGHYAQLSQEVLAALEQQKRRPDQDNNPGQWMALGALATHIQLGLRALRASQA